MICYFKKLLDQVGSGNTDKWTFQLRWTLRNDVERFSPPLPLVASSIGPANRPNSPPMPMPPPRPARAREVHETASLKASLSILIFTAAPLAVWRESWQMPLAKSSDGLITHKSRD